LYVSQRCKSDPARMCDGLQKPVERVKPEARETPTSHLLGVKTGVISVMHCKSTVIVEMEGFEPCSDCFNSQYLTTLNLEALAILHCPPCGVSRCTSLRDKCTEKFRDSQ
jgi:hypothetical protein